MFGFKILSEKKYRNLYIRNKNLFIQTKDQEKEIGLLKQKIELSKLHEQTIKELEIENSKLKKEKEQLLNDTPNYTLETPEIDYEDTPNYEQKQTKPTKVNLQAMSDILQPIKELTYFTYRELEVLSAISSEEGTTKTLAKTFITTPGAIAENMKNIRKKFKIHNFTLNERTDMGIKYYSVAPEVFQIAKEHHAQ